MSAGRKRAAPRAAFRPVEQPAKRVGDAGGGWAGKKGRQTAKKRTRGIGLCRVCGRRRKLRADGMVGQHDDRAGGQCAGQDTRPAAGSTVWR